MPMGWGSRAPRPLMRPNHGGGGAPPRSLEGPEGRFARLGDDVRRLPGKTCRLYPVDANSDKWTQRRRGRSGTVRR
eukprot:13186609-Alexandrium_andersonii.AAC.1